MWPTLRNPTGAGKQGLHGHGSRWLRRQDAVELVARADVELGENLVQVILDGPRTDEHPSADLDVRQPVAGEPRDLPLLGGELVARLDGALANRLAGGQ